MQSIKLETSNKNAMTVRLSEKKTANGKKQLGFCQVFFKEEIGLYCCINKNCIYMSE